MTVVIARMVQDPREDDEVEESDEFRCPVCDETFESQQELEEHGESEHGEHDDEELDKQP
jgi:uncharacterized C2H2 Zn-finger protein